MVNLNVNYTIYFSGIEVPDKNHLQKVDAQASALFSLCPVVARRDKRWSHVTTHRTAPETRCSSRAS